MAEATEPKRCALCMYWAEYKCHLSPPVILEDHYKYPRSTESFRIAIWGQPRTHANRLACGEFKPRSEP